MNKLRPLAPLAVAVFACSGARQPPPAFTDRAAPTGSAPIVEGAAHAKADSYQPIPSGFDFPAEQAALLRYRDAGDVPAMRSHAWMVWAGMNQPAPGGGPLWETWYPSDGVFAPPEMIESRKPGRRFRAPRQFQPALATEAQGQSLLSFVLFNEETRKHVLTNKLYLKEELKRLNDSFGNVSLEKRTVPDFPVRAMSLKAVWLPVKQSGKTALPVWDNEPTRPDEKGNPPSTWKRVVAVDPTRTQVPPGEETDVDFGGRKLRAHVVALAAFYSVRFETEEEVNSARTALGDSSLQVGDYAALVGMHMTTKEIPEWVWATFWWHDAPTTGRFAADRRAEVPGVFRNYLMDVAYSQELPKEADQQPHVCFNPWLEARFPRGMQSNCMTCHQRAVFDTNVFLPITRGALAPNDPYFAGKTKLDFLWSLEFESR